MLEGAHGVSGFQPSDGDLPALAGPCRSPARIECFIVTRRSRGGRISGQKDPGDVRHCDEGATHTESDLGTPAARRPRPDPPSSAWWPDSSTRVYQRVGRPTVAATPASRWRRKRGIPFDRNLTLRTPSSPERTARGHRCADVSNDIIHMSCHPRTRTSAPSVAASASHPVHEIALVRFRVLCASRDPRALLIFFVVYTG